MLCPSKVDFAETNTPTQDQHLTHEKSKGAKFIAKYTIHMNLTKLAYIYMFF